MEILSGFAPLRGVDCGVGRDRSKVFYYGALSFTRQNVK